MKVDALIAALSSAVAYPWLDPGSAVEVVQTHISVVFLVGREVFKVHKPVELGFLDFRTLQARRRDCEAELRVNASLAPGVYRGLAAVVRRAGGRVELEREGANADPKHVLEWAVWMRRLPDSATFASLLARGELGRPQLWSLVAELAGFYRAQAEQAAEPELERLGDVETIAANMRENFTQLDTLIEGARELRRRPPIDPDLLERLRRASEAVFARVRERLHARYEAGAIRDTHGDLRLDHIYALGYTGAEDRELVDEELLEACGRRELLIIDRIEFNQRFRWADPIADVAFLVMDLRAHGAWQLARCFADDFAAAGEDAAAVAELLPFYVGYRATVRAKVAAMAAAEPELGSQAQAAARDEAGARLRLALAELAKPRQRPCLVLVAGLPGTGKSMLARALREVGDFTWIRADEVRKRLAGLNPFAPAPADADGGSKVGEGLYTPEWSDKTYAACLDRAAQVCRAGGRALIDATFVDGHRRAAFVEAARTWGVPVHLLVVHAPPTVIRERLAARKGDPSDADWEVYEALRQRWSQVDLLMCPHSRVDASGSPGEVLADATRVLTRAGLL